MYFRKSLFFNDNKGWKKKSIDSCFHVTVGNYTRTKICKLAGFYTLPKLEKATHKDDMNLL